TQIIYNVKKFARFMEMVRDLGLHEKVYILAGVTPPKSFGMAKYMKNNVPGLEVTDEVLKRLRDSKDQREEGIDIAVDIINQVREIPGVAGCHIMAIEWEEAAPEIVKRAGLGPRPEVRGVEPVLVGQEALDVSFERGRSEAEAELKSKLEKARAEALASRESAARERERIDVELMGLKKELEAAKAMASQQDMEARAARLELEENRRSPGQVPMADMVQTGGSVCHGTPLSPREQVILRSLNLGLGALRKALGLTEEQFEAIRHFLEAEFMLHGGGMEPATVIEPAQVLHAAPQETDRIDAKIEAPPQVVAQMPVKDMGLPPCPEGFTEEEWIQKLVIRLVGKGNVCLAKGDVDGARDCFKKALDLKPGDEKAARGMKAVEAGGVVVQTAPIRPMPSEVPRPLEPRPEEKAGEAAAPIPHEIQMPEPKQAPREKVKQASKKKEEREVPTVAAAKATVSSLKKEAKSLIERSAGIPQDLFIERVDSFIREVTIGDDERAITVGGESALPFHLFEGDMPNPPRVALEVLDVPPEDWPECLSVYYKDVIGDPVAWARKCVNEFGARAVCLSLVSTDPNGLNRPSSDAAKTAKAVIDEINAPVILWGCGNAEKDTETLREVTGLIGSKKVCIAPLTDANYRNLGATAMAFGLPVVASTPIDVNLAKQLNILFENLGVSLNQILMDPSIGAVGYGLEYTYSVMERIRLAALTQQDDKLQAPFICQLGREVWKAKETKLPTDPYYGDQEKRGVLMEAVTASVLMLAGGELMVMRHPHAASLVDTLVQGMM
ncbi:MAG: acetyl-CoA decarbonylase/synthase complex subunit delta, partial [Dissulfurimicrobium sp.]